MSKSEYLNLIHWKGAGAGGPNKKIVSASEEQNAACLV
jgi:hypothetical protein